MLCSDSVMATWCFVSEEAESCCSPAVYGSIVRSLTYSFGSICFGSLLQGIVSLLRALVKNARSYRQNDNQEACSALCFCIVDCCTRCLEELLEYFNQVRNPSRVLSGVLSSHGMFVPGRRPVGLRLCWNLRPVVLGKRQESHGIIPSSRLDVNCLRQACFLFFRFCQHCHWRHHWILWHRS